MNIFGQDVYGWCECGCGFPLPSSTHSRPILHTFHCQSSQVQYAKGFSALVLLYFVVQFAFKVQLFYHSSHLLFIYW